MSRFPPRGPRRVASSPASVGTIKTLRFPVIHFASLRFLRSAIPREHTAAFVSSVVAACRTTDLELVTRFSGRESLPWKQQGLPSSWGTRTSICTCSSTPVGRTVPHQKRNARTVPAKKRTKTPTRNPISRLNSMAFGLAVYASQCRLPKHHARLASGCRLRSAGQALARIGFR